MAATILAEAVLLAFIYMLHAHIDHFHLMSERQIDFLTVK